MPSTERAIAAVLRADKMDEAALPRIAVAAAPAIEVWVILAILSA